MTAMPLYEYRCGACGARFEDLVAAGSPAPPCPECGAARSERLLSAQAPPPHLARTPKERRKQEARNAELRARTKEAFKERRRRAREARSGRRDG